MKFRKVTDLNIPELQIFCERAETGLLHCFEPEPGLFIAETPMIAKRALEAGYVPVSALGEEKILRETAEELSGYLKDIPVYEASKEVLSEIAGYKLLRGFLCAMRRRPLQEPSGILEDAKRVVVLENVMNPTNVGAIFRSAAALGMDAVLLNPGCTDPFYRRAVRVSMGAVFMIPWTFTDKRKTPADRMEMLKSRGFYTISMALTDDAVPLCAEAFSNREKLAVFMGSEYEGLCRETIEKSDAVLKIPMSAGVDSLNVAAASAVVFWELGKKS